MAWLDNARLLAMFAVVFLHTAAYAVTLTEFGSAEWWIGNFYNSLVRWCVPAFVMVSGALLLDPEKQEDARTFYRKRLSRIAIPLAFWSAFYLLWTALKGRLKHEPLSPNELMLQLLAGKPYYHLWFLFMIIQLYAFTPWFRRVVAHSSRRDVAWLTATTLALAAVHAIGSRLLAGGATLFSDLFLSFIPFYFLGYLVRTGKFRIPKTLLAMVFIVSVSVTALGCYVLAIHYGLNTGFYFYDYLSITVIPMSHSVMLLLKWWTAPAFFERLARTLSPLTLGVYLMHPVILDVLQYLGLGPLSFPPAISIPVIAIVTFGLSLAGSWIVYQIPYLRRII